MDIQMVCAADAWQTGTTETMQARKMRAWPLAPWVNLASDFPKKPAVHYVPTLNHASFEFSIRYKPFPICSLAKFMKYSG
jgi:hypothetical protein